MLETKNLLLHYLMFLIAIGLGKFKKFCNFKLKVKFIVFENPKLKFLFTDIKFLKRMMVGYKHR